MGKWALVVDLCNGLVLVALIKKCAQIAVCCRNQPRQGDAIRVEYGGSTWSYGEMSKSWGVLLWQRVDEHLVSLLWLFVARCCSADISAL